MPEPTNRREKLEHALDRARRVAERGVKDVGDAVSRGLHEVTDRARRTGKKDSGDNDALGPGVEDVAADPAAFFSAEQQRAMEQLGHANILISGQTGAGKSTLINAVFRVPLAVEGIGKPVTRHVQKHEVPGVPVTIYDTPGIELGQAKDEVIREYRKTITESRKGLPNDLIHVAWYCINTGQSRIQDYDIEIIRALADELPVILVLTQCIDDEHAGALEAVIREEKLPIDGDPVRTLSRARRVAGQEVPPRGLEQLVERTNDILPEAVRRAFANAQGVVIRLKANQARAIVGASSVAAAGIGAAPIPVPDAAVLLPVQLGMLAGITAVFGIDMSNERAVNLIRGLVGQGGITVVGRQIAESLLKVVPGVNFINAAVASALTAALGEAYIKLSSEMLRHEATGKPMPEMEMLPFLLDAYKKAFKNPGLRKGKSSDARARQGTAR
ncbi:MAG TPA: GTPase [Solirubrobacteraceae bacterium]|nr:GTPase [Solirubrobacteraceae bacterium]